MLLVSSASRTISGWYVAVELPRGLRRRGRNLGGSPRRGSVDSLVLQRALGHSTLAMVNRYVHFQAKDLLAAWRARSD
jgi:integrase